MPDRPEGEAPAFAGSEFVASGLLALLLHGAFFLPALVAGRPLSLDAAGYTDSLFAGTPAARGYRPLLLEDPAPIEQDIPWMLFAARCVRAGEAPLWNPHQAAGTPLLANFQSAPLYPLKLAVYLWPGVAGINLFLLLRLLVTGPLMYGLSRSIGLSRAAAFFTQTAWSLSGFLVAHLYYVSISTVALLPLVLWAAERLAQAPGARRAAQLGLVFGLMLFSGHPEIIFNALFGAGLWYAVRVGARWRAERNGRTGRTVGAAVGWGGVAAVCGLALAACLLLPFGEYLTQAWSYKFARPEAASILPLAPAQAVRRAAALLCPNLSECLLPNWDPAVMEKEVFSLADSYAYLAYCGAATLALALYAALRRRVPAPCVALLVLVAGVAFPVPVLDLLRALPLLGYSKVHYTLFLMTCALALAAGRGLDALTEDLAGARPRLYGALAALFPAAAAMGYVYYRSLAWSTPAAGRRLFDEVLAELEPAALPQLGPAIAERLLAPALVWAVLLLCCRLAAAGRLPRRALGPALVVLCALDLLANGAGYVPAQRAFGYPESPALAELRRRGAVGGGEAGAGTGTRRGEPCRVLGLWGANLAPNGGTACGIDDVRVTDPLQVRRYREAVLLADPAIGGQATGTATNRAEARLWNLLGARYVIQSVQPTTLGCNLYPEFYSAALGARAAAPPRALDAGQFEKVWEDGYCRIFENRAALPRAFLVERAAGVAPGRGAVAAVAAALREGEDYAFDRRFVVEDVDGALAARLAGLGGSGAAGGGGEGPAPAACAVETVGAREVRVRAEAARPALLVLADTYYAGWSAEVDGSAATIYPVNHLVRGVFVGAGRHEVVFRYSPWSWRAGLAISLAGLAACVVLLWRGRGRP